MEQNNTDKNKNMPNSKIEEQILNYIHVLLCILYIYALFMHSNKLKLSEI